jgi:hypothetical protein
LDFWDVLDSLFRGIGEVNGGLLTVEIPDNKDLLADFDEFSEINALSTDFAGFSKINDVSTDFDGLSENDDALVSFDELSADGDTTSLDFDEVFEDGAGSFDFGFDAEVRGAPRALTPSAPNEFAKARTCSIESKWYPLF